MLWEDRDRGRYFPGCHEAGSVRREGAVGWIGECEEGGGAVWLVEYEYGYAVCVVSAVTSAKVKMSRGLSHESLLVNLVVSHRSGGDRSLG